MLWVPKQQELRGIMAENRHKRRQIFSTVEGLGSGCFALPNPTSVSKAGAVHPVWHEFEPSSFVVD